MKKLLVALIISLLLIISTAFVGCGSEVSAEAVSDRGRIEVLSIDNSYESCFFVLRDTETGVCYLMVRSIHRDQPVAITLMLDPDGKPLLRN